MTSKRKMIDVIRFKEPGIQDPKEAFAGPPMMITFARSDMNGPKGGYAIEFDPESDLVSIAKAGEPPEEEGGRWFFTHVSNTYGGSFRPGTPAAKPLEKLAAKLDGKGATVDEMIKAAAQPLEKLAAKLDGKGATVDEMIKAAAQKAQPTT